MKILLLVPPWNYNKLRNKKYFNKPYLDTAMQGVLPPIGILSIGTCLKKAGYDVGILDGYFHSKEKILNYISVESPDLVGISVITCLWDETIELLREIKKINSKIFTIIGGPHANLYLKTCLNECEALDAVAFGEGEVILPILADYIDRQKKDSRNDNENNIFPIEKINGVITRNSNIIKHALVENINNIPYPDITLLNPFIASYIPNAGISCDRPFAAVYTTRGCLMACSFCNEGNLYGSIRKRNINNILDEIENLVKKNNIKTINFYDDVSIFNCDSETAFTLCEEFIKRKYDFRWTIYLTNYNIELNLLKIMKKAGCFRIHCAIESGVQKNRDYIRGHHYPLEKIREKITDIKKAEIETYGRFMFGIFGETYSEGLKTIEYACSLDLDFASFIKCLLSPGTRMFQDLEKIKHINSDRKTWSYYGNFYEPYPMSKKEAQSLIKHGYNKFYFNINRAINISKKINSFKAIRQYFYYLYRVMADR